MGCDLLDFDYDHFVRFRLAIDRTPLLIQSDRALPLAVAMKRLVVQPAIQARLPQTQNFNRIDPHLKPLLDVPRGTSQISFGTLGRKHLGWSFTHARHPESTSK